MTPSPVLISPADLQSLMAAEPTVLIDTRDADTYAAGHLPGAVHMREIFTFLASSTAEGLEALKSSFIARLRRRWPERGRDRRVL
jgi:thiosulfate/3-mercaptopyruvate sulfurtransferase